MIGSTTIAVPLAWYQSITHHVAQLNNLVGTLPLPHQHGNVTDFNIHNQTSVPSPTFGNIDAHTGGDHDASRHPGMRLGVGASANAPVDLDNIFYDPLPVIHDVSGMDQEAINRDWANFLDLDESNSQLAQSWNVASTSPVDPRSIDCNSSPTPASFDSAPVATRARSVHRCSHCMLSFTRAGDLRRHSLTHNPDAPRLACNAAGCHRQFKRKDKLVDHMKIHRGPTA